MTNETVYREFRMYSVCSPKYVLHMCECDAFSRCRIRVVDIFMYTMVTARSGPAHG